MKDFVRHLNLQDFAAHFSFSRILCPNSLRYHVTARGPAEQHCEFNMQEVGGRWRIIDAPKVPDWVIRGQGELDRVIREEEENGDRN